MSGTGVFRRGLTEIVHRREEIVFHQGFTNAKRMSDLTGGFDIMLRRGREHAAKQGDIHRHRVFAQEIQFIYRRRAFFHCQRAGQRMHTFSFRRTDMRELLGVGVNEGIFLELFLIFFAFHFAETGCDRAAPLNRFGLRDAARQHDLHRLAADARGTGADMPAERRLKEFRGAPGALEALRRDTQARRAADGDGFRRASVVAVQVSGRVSG